MTRRAPNGEAPVEDRAVILAVRFPDEPDFEGLVEETAELVRAAGMTVAGTVVAPRRSADRRSLVGKGKVAEARAALGRLRASSLVVTHTLTDGQHARLSEDCGAGIVDRTGLILEIFGRRAKTSEGKLQVELAEEIYGRAKLKGAWTHLERQRGGLGATGGPGERQLELDRRMTARRIGALRRRLERCRRHSDLSSARRRKGPFSVALVGYTNAGKSTLFARLTKERVPASRRLFETLSTTSRKAHLGEGRDIVVSDTVGFIRSLPHELVEAFRSTLNEAVIADMLLVVADGSDPRLPERLEVIEDTIGSIGAGHVPRVLALNKSDLAGNGRPDTAGWDRIPVLRISAATGEGLPRLRAMLADRVTEPAPVSNKRGKPAIRTPA